MKNDTNNVLKKSIIKIVMGMVIWTIILVIAFALLKTYFSLADFQWIYDISPDLYLELKYNYLNNNSLIIFLLIIWMIGILVLLIKVLGKFKTYIDALTDATSKIFDKNIEYIELPSELEEFQTKLNRLKRESEKNEAKARESEKRKNDLIVYLAHDLKTPLTSTIGYLSLLDEVKDMPFRQKEKYIKIALDKAYRLEDLINELFDIARFNSEEITLEKEQLDLNLMLEQIVDDFYPLLKENNKEIKLIFQEKITIDGDSFQLCRLFSNLIKNAIYYSTDKLITIALTKSFDYATITVANKGKKIPPEKLAKIFEKFYRVDSSRGTNSGGSGLGLAIAKEIAELHNGSIIATSDDNYTNFYVNLPL